MDILALIVAAALALGSAGGGTTSGKSVPGAGSHIGSESSRDSGPGSPEDTEARSHIIDLG